MKFKLGSQWLEDRSSVTRLLERVLTEAGQANKYLFELSGDVQIFREGEKLNNIYILLEGSVQLWKRKPYNEAEFPVLKLESGSLIGIMAFATGMESLTTARTLEPCRFFRIPKRDVEHLEELHPNLSGYLDELLMANLVERFRQTVILQMKLDSANNKLKDERNEVKEAYAELQKAQKQLIHQEKMATLGQLVAGFAHEVNNPTAALIRSIDNLETHLQRFMKEAITDRDPQWLSAGRLFFERGKKAGYHDTRTIRERTELAAEHFPDARKPQLRLIARMPDDLMEMLVRQSNVHPGKLGYFLDQFEFGMMFQNIESSGERISGLVRSLKSYSRSDSEERIEEIDIREGIHDTLQLTSNRIKFYELYLDLPEIPQIRADAAGLNQVWTNIILNAADAMGKQGSLDIRCGHNTEEGHLWVTIRDSGPGIPEENLKKIFEPSFTTKQTGAKFGLGLGLSISKDIVENHGGTIEAANSREGGARLTVTLPV